MLEWKKRHKLTVQTVALLMTMVATWPVYAGLQGGQPALTWAGLITVALGMAVGLWVS